LNTLRTPQKASGAADVNFRSSIATQLKNSGANAGLSKLLILEKLLVPIVYRLIAGGQREIGIMTIACTRIVQDLHGAIRIALKEL
jgi:hypothetical protein